MASAQRPVTLAALQGEATKAAWRTIPSWDLIGRQDEAFVVAAQRFMAKRMNARTTEVNASHASFLARPAEVANVILRAAQSVR